ncbi:hypothetical protein ACHAO1_000525, partial [Botrytis cinerea]
IEVGNENEKKRGYVGIIETLCEDCGSMHVVDSEESRGIAWIPMGVEVGSSQENEPTKIW